MTTVTTRPGDGRLLGLLVAGRTWDTACDALSLTPAQRRDTARRLRLVIDDMNGRPRNLPLVVAAAVDATVGQQPARTRATRGSGRSRGAGAIDAAASIRALGITPTTLRTWAKATGLDVGDRGVIPRHVIDAYRAARQQAAS